MSIDETIKRINERIAKRGYVSSKKKKKVYSIYPPLTLDEAIERLNTNDYAYEKASKSVGMSIKDEKR
jgi:predicted transcriptional regulator